MTAAKTAQSSFKQANAINERISQFKKVTENYPNKIPVIVERAQLVDKYGNAVDPDAEGNPAIGLLPKIDKNKYLVPGDLTVAQFLCLIRKRIKLGNDQALFIYINGTLPATSAMFASLYADHKDPDGFLYVQYTGESTFG